MVGPDVTLEKNKRRFVGQCSGSLDETEIKARLSIEGLKEEKSEEAKKVEFS